jgi:hypothetical protein
MNDYVWMKHGAIGAPHSPACLQAQKITRELWRQA